MKRGGERGGSSVPDEEWERFLQESVDGTADAPEEPSARARSVARRLAEEPARPEPWRTYTPARPGRRTGWYVVGLLVVLALLVVAVAPDRVTGWFEGGAGAPLAAETERPDQAPPGSTAGRATLDEPFRGSPAELWQSGTAGITVPAARATGWMSAPQVEDALGRTLDFLAASNLDPGVLRGERPGTAIALLNPHQKDVQDYVTAAFRTPDEENDPLLLFSRFDASQAHLVGDVVRTRGRMTYQEGERGALQVTADVTFVYPVAPAAPDSDEVGRTIVRRELVMNWDDPAKVITEPGTFSLVSYTSDTTNGGCDAVSGYLTPVFGSGRPESGADGGPTVDPFDRSTPMAERMKTADEGCGTATRS